MRVHRLFPLLLALNPPNPVVAIPSFGSQAYQQPHLAEPNAPGLQYQDQTPLRIWPKLRDTVIEAVWGRPKHDRRPVDERSSDISSSAPPSLQARYGEDVVLRFTIKSPDDIEALREASNILFLDVWAFTDEWVDIRLAKDVVCFCVYWPMEICGLLISVKLGSLPPRIASELIAEFSCTIDSRSCANCLRVISFFTPTSRFPTPVLSFGRIFSRRYESLF